MGRTGGNDTERWSAPKTEKGMSGPAPPADVHIHADAPIDRRRSSETHTDTQYAHADLYFSEKCRDAPNEFMISQVLYTVFIIVQVDMYIVSLGFLEAARGE